MNNFAAFFHMCTMEVVAAIGSAPRVVAALDQQFSRVASGVLAALTGVTMFVTGSIAQLLPGDQLAAVATVYDGAPTQQYTATTSQFGDGSALSAGQDRSMRDAALGQNGYVVNNYYPRTTQTIIQTLSQNEYVTTSLLGSVLNDLAASFDNKLSSLTAPAQAIPQQIAAGGNGGYAASNAISTLANTTINSPSVSGGSISNASVSATTLSAGDSSLGSTTVGSLLVTGNTTLNGTLGLSGILTGTDANFSGTLTAGSLSVAGVSSGGAITAPYFSATNTAATSSFQGLTSVFSNITNGIISTLTSTVATITNLVATNATTTNATTTSFAITGLTNSLLSTNSLGSVVATTSPTAVSFTATGASATSTFAGGLIGPNNFVIQQGSGNVGIGTASPGAPLTVNLNASTPQTPPSGTVIDLVGKDSTQARFLFDSYNQSGQFVFRRANTSAASPSALVSGDNIGFITGMGYGATSYSTLGHGGFAIDAAENWTDSAQGTQLRFLTVPTGSTSQTERMRIDPSGNVGIGTTSPNRNLTIGNGTGNPAIRLDGGTGAAGGFIEFSKGGGTVSSIGTDGGIAGNNNTDLALFAAGNTRFYNNSATPSMFINTVGSVGIGTIGPVSPLHVLNAAGNDNGVVRIEGTTLPSLSVVKTGIQAYSAFVDTANNNNFSIANSNAGVTGSSRLLTITSTGNVGIGTTTPNHPLNIGRYSYVDNDGSNEYAVFGSQAAGGGGTRMQIAADTIRFGNTFASPSMILSNGNVGIGTTGPDSKLDVAGSLKVSGAGTYSSTPGATYGGFLQADSVGTVHFDSYNPLGGSAIAFGTQSSGAVSERMRITSGGNVGIGTTTPQTTFVVNGTSQFTNFLTLSRNDTTAPIGYIGPYTNIVGFGGVDPTIYSNTGNILLMNGNVGIGTVSPFGPLHVHAATNQNIILSGARDLSSGTTLWSVNDANSAYQPLELSGSTIALMNGNVGIGTTGPTDKLSVVTSGTDANMLVGVDQTNRFGRLSYSNGSDIFSIQGGAWGGTTRPLVLQGGGGNVGIGTTTIGTRFDMQAAANNSNVSQIFGSNGGILSAFFADGSNNSWLRLYSGSGSEQIRLNSNGNTYFNGGNVGIGTTSPLAKLQVWDNSNSILKASYSGGVQVMGAGNNAALNIAGVGAYPIMEWYNVGGSSGLGVIDSSGNVGIGTTTPYGQLDIYKNATAGDILLGVQPANNNYNALFLNGQVSGGNTYNFLSSATDQNLYINRPSGKSINFRENNNDQMVIASGGNVGIGLSPTARLDIQQTADTSAFNGFRVLNSANTRGGFFWVDASSVVRLDSGSAGTGALALNAGGGNVGIGTTTPTAQFSTTGTVRFSNFGAGTLQTDANGNLSVSSDERLKNINGAFTRGAADVLKLSPILYHWNATSGLDQVTQYAGFSAQNVQAVIPEAVGTSSNGYLSLQDRPILAAVVNALKDVLSISGLFRDNLIAWLGNAANEIDVLFAKNIYASNVTSDIVIAKQKLCIGLTCVTEDQLKALLAASGSAGQTTASAGSGSGSQTPSATLVVNGGDDVTHAVRWQINAAWQDNLGALFTHGGVNETIYSTSTVDTTVVGTTTIDYWATWYPDPSDTTSAHILHATREVAVYDPDQVAPQPSSDAGDLGPFAPLPEASPAGTSPTTP